MLRDRLASHTGSPTVTVTAPGDSAPRSRLAPADRTRTRRSSPTWPCGGGRAELAGDDGATELTATLRW